MFALADNHEKADGDHVLDWSQAQARALKLARGQDETATDAPATVDSGLTDYERSLKAEGGDPSNAYRVRYHMTPKLLAKPIAMLTDRDLRRWRNGLVEAGVNPATVSRTCRALRAALNLAATADRKRITKASEWRSALGKLAGDDNPPRKFDVHDETVLALIDAAYQLDPAFGLLCESAAETGARMSQLARVKVSDLHLGADPKLGIPPSRKGSRRKKPKDIAVPISPELATKLETAAGDREADAVLLLRTNGTTWRRVPRWRTAYQSISVSGIVKNGHAPAVVPDAVIADIRRRERDGVVELRRLRVGSRVRILSGAFRNRLGLCADMNGAQRVSVLLDLLGSQREVRLRADAAEPVDGVDSRPQRRRRRASRATTAADR